MTRNEHLLTAFAEECVESAQRATKALRFSLGEVQPGQLQDNAQRLLQEFLEAIALLEMMQDEKLIPVHDAEWVEEYKARKKLRFEKYLNLSKQNGTLQEV